MSTIRGTCPPFTAPRHLGSCDPVRDRKLGHPLGIGSQNNLKKTPNFLDADPLIWIMDLMKNNRKATPKSPEIEAFLADLMGASRVGAVAEGSCVACSGTVSEFRNTLSEKEYTISGFCQDCQDLVGFEEDR